jgi:hypothetical protein
MAMQTTTRCTLSCKYCSCSYPRFKPPRDSELAVIAASLEKVFRILEHVSEFRIAGAEAFLHPDINAIISEVANYKAQFDFINIVTNGTYIPKMQTLSHLAGQDCKTLVRIDNYGELSSKLKELVSALENHGIDHEIRDNYDHNLYCDGWIDFGTEYAYKAYSPEFLSEMFYVCNNRICPIVWDGIWYACSFCASGHLLGKIPIAKRDCVDLLSDTPIDEMKKIVEAFPDAPYVGCEYCNGFDVENSPRIPAAEQMSDTRRR